MIIAVFLLVFLCFFFSYSPKNVAARSESPPRCEFKCGSKIIDECSIYFTTPPLSLISNVFFLLLFPHDFKHIAPLSITQSLSGSGDMRGNKNKPHL